MWSGSPPATPVFENSISATHPRVRPDWHTGCMPSSRGMYLGDSGSNLPSPSSSRLTGRLLLSVHQRRMPSPEDRSSGFVPILPLSEFRAGPQYHLQVLLKYLSNCPFLCSV